MKVATYCCFASKKMISFRLVTYRKPSCPPCLPVSFSLTSWVADVTVASNGWQSNRDVLWLKTLVWPGRGRQACWRQEKFNQYWTKGSTLLFFFLPNWPCDLLAPQATLKHLPPSMDPCWLYISIDRLCEVFAFEQWRYCISPALSSGNVFNCVVATLRRR